MTILGAAYDHFALYADQAHMRTIAQTLQFASLVGSAGPVPSPWEGLVYRTQGALWCVDAEGAPVQVFADPQAVLSPDGAQVVACNAADDDAWEPQRLDLAVAGTPADRIIPGP